jgi:hypothetical protein
MHEGSPHFVIDRLELPEWSDELHRRHLRVDHLRKVTSLDLALGMNTSEVDALLDWDYFGGALQWFIRETTISDLEESRDEETIQMLEHFSCPFGRDHHLEDIRAVLEYVDRSPATVWSPRICNLSPESIVLKMREDSPAFQIATKHLAYWAEELYRRNIAVDHFKKVHGGMFQLAAATGCELDLLDELMIRPTYVGALWFFVRSHPFAYWGDEPISRERWAEIERQRCGPNSTTSRDLTE